MKNHPYPYRTNKAPSASDGYWQKCTDSYRVRDGVRGEDHIRFRNFLPVRVLSTSYFLLVPVRYQVLDEDHRKFPPQSKGDFEPNSRTNFRSAVPLRTPLPCGVKTRNKQPSSGKYFMSR